MCVSRVMHASVSSSAASLLEKPTSASSPSPLSPFSTDEATSRAAPPARRPAAPADAKGKPEASRQQPLPPALDPRGRGLGRGAARRILLVVHRSSALLPARKSCRERILTVAQLPQDTEAPGRPRRTPHRRQTPRRSCAGKPPDSSSERRRSILRRPSTALRASSCPAPLEALAVGPGCVSEAVALGCPRGGPPRPCRRAPPDAPPVPA